MGRGSHWIFVHVKVICIALQHLTKKSSISGRLAREFDDIQWRRKRRKKRKKKKVRKKRCGVEILDHVIGALDASLLGPMVKKTTNVDPLRWRFLPPDLHVRSQEQPGRCLTAASTS